MVPEPMIVKFRLSLPLRIAALAALLTVGCGAPPVQTKTPDHWSKNAYAWPDESHDLESGKQIEHDSTAPALAKQAPAKERSRHQPRPSTPPFIHRTGTPEPTLAPLQEGQECLSDLRRSGVTFQPLGSLKGVENPVRVTGTLGGISFYASDGRALELDCRLALALAELTPVFRAHGVTRARFSGAYSYRQTRTGRLSHHALGLAIDLHDISFGDRTLSVKGDFARNVGCGNDAPHLNQLACQMRNSRMFEEFLTPDFNQDHHDHLHISVPKRRPSR